MKKSLKYIFNLVRSFQIRKKNRLFKELFRGEESITLLDIGAAGSIEPRWQSVANILEYIGLEPDKRSSKELKNNFGCKKYEIIENVIWSEQDEITFYLCEKPKVSSAYMPNKDFIDNFPNSKRFQIVDSFRTKTSTIDKEIPNRVVDFVKIDIQGAELKALQGMENIIKNCLGFELEIEFSEIYKYQPLFGEIDKFLKERDFEFIDFTNLYRWDRNKYNSYGQCIFGDGIWLRTPEFIINNCPEKFKKYIIICALYGRLDLIKIVLSKSDKVLSQKNKKIINSLSKFQRNTQFVNYLSDKALKLISGDYTTKSHLIY